MSNGAKTVRATRKYEYRDEECEITVLAYYARDLIDPEIVFHAHATYNEQTYYVEGAAIVKANPETQKYTVDWSPSTGGHYRNYHASYTSAAYDGINQAEIVARIAFGHKVDESVRYHEDAAKMLDHAWEVLKDA